MTKQTQKDRFRMRAGGKGAWGWDCPEAGPGPRGGRPAARAGAACDPGKELRFGETVGGPAAQRKAAAFCFL